MIDYPQQALRNMWDYHRHSDRMRNWLRLRGPGILRRVGYDDWTDIETHARMMNWPGTVNDNMPFATSIVVRGEAGKDGERNEGGDGKSISRKNATLKKKRVVRKVSCCESCDHSWCINS